MLPSSGKLLGLSPKSWLYQAVQIALWISSILGYPISLHMNTDATEVAVGKEIVSYCTKCKMDLGHTIMAMKGANPARVMCRTCKSEHNFKVKKGIKDPNAVKVAKVPKEKKEKVDKAVPVELEWMKQINGSTKSLRHYAANEAFHFGDKVSHPSFGEGIVQKLIFPNKIEVLFRTDMKLLIHAGKQAS
jgi:hypothetical protein